MDVLKGEEGKRVAGGGRHFRPTSGERLRGQGVSVFFSDIFHVSRLYHSVTHSSPSLTASLAILVPKRSQFYEVSISLQSCK